VIVGVPLRLDSALYNCAVAINRGKIIGVSPKQFVPNYNEFYESRYFASATNDLPDHILINGEPVPFGTQLLYRHTCGRDEVVVYAEICEAVWMPVPPSSLASVAGANILCNLSASPETIGKADYRKNLVAGQSGRCIAAYAYSSCGPTESTADLVFGGHAMIAQGGHLTRSQRTLISRSCKPNAARQPRTLKVGGTCRKLRIRRSGSSCPTTQPTWSAR